MKKIIWLVIIIIILPVAWYLLSPFFIDKKVSEELPVSKVDSSLTEELAVGTFSGFDKLHQGSGTVKIIKADNNLIIRLEEDFNVSNGPDLYVGLGKDGNYKKGSEVAELKGNIGSQNYLLPKEINLNDFNEIWIWCNRFGVPFAKAHLVYTYPN